MVVSRLLKAMSDKGYNQKQLAEATGLTESAICRYLQGSRTAREDALIKVSRALGVSIDWLPGNESWVKQMSMVQSTMGQLNEDSAVNESAE